MWYMLALALLSEIVAFVARQPSPYDYPYGSGNERFCSDSFYTIYDAVSGVPLLIILMKQPLFFYTTTIQSRPSHPIGMSIRGS